MTGLSRLRARVFSQARTPCYPRAVALGMLMLTGACKQTVSEPRAGADDASVSSAPTTWWYQAQPHRRSTLAGSKTQPPIRRMEGHPTQP
jgi:hypothetical protein